MGITPDLIKQLAYIGMPRVLTEIWASKLSAACGTAGINTPQRLAHFLAQILTESGGFRWLTEIWGPTPAQVRYEGRLDLGNVNRGDGKRYRGRGPLMLTGRSNYRNVGRRIRYPLESQPQLASQIGVGSLIAADFWTAHNLNKLADQGGLPFVRPITLVVNGGLNGLADRERRFSLAALALGMAVPLVKP